MGKKIKTLLAILLSIITFLGFNNIAFAQASRINLSISPPVNYLSVKPGESEKYEIYAENLGDSVLEVVPNLLDFEADNQTGQPVVKQTGTFQHIKLNDGVMSFDEPFYLDPKQKQKIIVTINIPKNASEEEYAMTIFFTFKNKLNESVSDSKAKVAGTVGSNLILLVTRNNSDRGNILVKSIKSIPTIDSFMPIRFSALAENIGRNATLASGSATITNWQNQELAHFDIHPDMVLAGSSREVREKEFLSSQFRFKKPFLIGMYKITVELNKNSQEEAEKVSLSKTIVALPFSIIILPLSAFILYSGYSVILKKSKSQISQKNETV